MKRPWYKKSKYNNSPVIFFQGTCPNCGRKHKEPKRNFKVTCCEESVICNFAVDENIGKVDCMNRSKGIINNGMVADLLNEGKTFKEAFSSYYKFYWKNRESIF